jgi:hypothetical protein
MWHINEAHDNFNAGTKGRVYLQGEALEGQTLTLVNTLSDLIILKLLPTTLVNSCVVVIVKS